MSRPRKILSFIDGIWIVSFFGAVVIAGGCNETASNKGVTSDAVEYGVEHRLSNLVSEFGDVQEILSLEEGDAKRIDDVHREFGSILKEWYAENGGRLNSIRASALQAAKDRDLRKLKQMDANGDKAMVAELTAQEKQIQTDYELALFSAIPESKRSTWQEHIIAKNLIRFLKPIKLSAEQIVAIHELAPAALQHAIRKGSNWRSVGTSNLESEFEKNALGDSQRADFEELKKKNPLRMLMWNG